MEKVVPWVKWTLRVWKRVSPRLKRTPYLTFITIWSFLIKPLKNGLKNGKKIYFFAEIDETLGGPSACPYDSIRMPSMVKNTDTKALITSLGHNTKMITPALEVWVKNSEIISRLFNNQ